MNQTLRRFARPLAAALAVVVSCSYAPAAYAQTDSTFMLRNRFEDLTGACLPRGWTGQDRSGLVFGHVTSRWSVNTPFMAGLKAVGTAGQITQNAFTSRLGTPRGAAEGDSGSVLFLDSNPDLSWTLYQVYPDGFLRPYAQFTEAQDPRSVARDPVQGGAIVTLPDGLARVPAGGGVPVRIAGGGTYPYSDTTAAEARFFSLRGIVVDAAGNAYFADESGHMVHMLRANDGRVIGIAGTGTMGSTGDGFLARNALLTRPWGIALDAAGAVLYIMSEGETDFSNLHRSLRQVSLVTGVITGTAVPEWQRPRHIAMTALGLLALAPGAVRQLNAGAFASLTAAYDDYFSDPAAENQLDELRLFNPDAIAPTADGGFLMISNQLVYRVSAAGVVSAAVGTPIPVQMDTRAFWFGADVNSAPDEVANWTRDWGYGNNWSQRLVSPAIAYAAGDDVRFSLVGLIEIGQGRLGFEFPNEGIALEGQRADGSWVRLTADFNSYDTPLWSYDQVSGREVIQAEARLTANGNEGNGPYQRVRVRMQSDARISDEDGIAGGAQSIPSTPTVMGGLLVDNLRVTVNGAPVATADFEDGTTNGWTPDAYNGYYVTSFLFQTPNYTRDGNRPTTEVEPRPGFDSQNPSCAWTFTGVTGVVEPGTYATLTSPWVALGDPSLPVLIQYAGKLNTQFSGFSTQIWVRTKQSGDTRPEAVAPTFALFNSGTPGTDNDSPLLANATVTWPTDFDIADAGVVDSIQVVFHVMDVHEAYGATLNVTRLPFFDDIRIVQVGADPDGDGVPAVRDACPAVAATGEDADGDGCLDPNASLHHVESWANQDRPIRYRLALGGSPAIGDVSDFGAIQAAFATWAGVAGASVPVVEDPVTTQQNASAFDGINLITFQDPDYTFPPGVLAITPTLSYVKQGAWDDRLVLPGQILDADLIFNPQASFGTSSVPGQFDLQGVATHEIGHLLGLSHSGVLEATMFYVIQPGTEAGTLAADDQAAIAAAYPAPSLATDFGAIRGQVRRGSNAAPVRGALVTGRQVNNQGDPIGPEISDYTRDDGTYALQRLAAGDYAVRVDPVDGSQGGLTPDRINEKVLGIAEINFQAEWWSDPEDGGDDPAARTAIPVTTGATASAIDIVTNVDLVPPEVVSVTPAADSTDVGIDALITVAFSEPIALGSLQNAFSLRVQGAPTGLAGTGQVIGGTRLVFAPGAPLQFGTTYDIQLSTGLTDDEGVPLAAPFTSSFTTQAQPPLSITNVIPASAYEGQLITIEGTGFASDDSLKQAYFFFPPEAAAVLVPVTVLDATHCVVRVPIGAATGPLQLLFSGGSSSNPFAVTILPPPPQAAPVASGDPVALTFAPSDLALSPDGTRAYAVGAGGFVSVDLTAANRVAVPHSQDAAEAIALTPDGLRAAVTRAAAGTLDIVNTNPASGGYGSVLQSIPVGRPPRAVALSADGRRAHVVAGTDEVHEIDIDPASATAWQTLFRRRVPGYGTLKPLVTLDPRGTTLYLAGEYYGMRIPISPDTLPVIEQVVYAADGGVAISPSGLEYLAASTPGYAMYTTAALDEAGTITNAAQVNLGLAPRDVSVAREGQSGFIVDQTLNQLNVIDIVRGSANYRQPVGAITTGQAPVAVTTASLASVIGVANQGSRTLSFYTYGNSGLALLSVVPPVAFPGDAVSVDAAGDVWTAGTQVDLGGALTPASPTVGTAVAFRVPALGQQATSVVLDNGTERSYSGALTIVEPPGGFGPQETGVLPPVLDMFCFGDIGVGAPREALLSPDGRILALWSEHPYGCNVITFIQASAGGSDSLGRVLRTTTLQYPLVDMAFTADSRELWVMQGPHNGQRLDADPNSVTFGTSLGLSVGIGQPGHVAMDPLGRWMFVHELFPNGPEPIGVGLVNRDGTLADSLDLGSGPLVVSPDGRWLAGIIGAQTRVVLFDLTNLGAPAVLSTDRSASGAGAPLHLEVTSDGRRVVAVFSNDYVQIVNLDPALGPIGQESWFGQPFPPGGPGVADLARGTTPSTVVAVRGPYLFRLDAALAPPQLIQVQPAHPAERIDVAPDGRRIWAARGYQPTVSEPPFINTSIVDLLAVGDGASLALLAGGDQQVLINQTLPTAIRVKVTDATGAPEPGVVVRFTAPAGTTLPEAPGRLTLDRLTDVDGEALASWAMGDVAGTYAMSIQTLGTALSPLQVSAVASLDDASILPAILSFGPANGATGLGAATPVYVSFNQRMQLATVTPLFSLTANSAPVTGSFSTPDDGRTIVFQPSSPLPYSAACQITMGAGALDTDGQALGNGGSASFTVQAPPTLAVTALSPPSGPPGAPVVVQGAGFSPTPASNVVLFNGTLAPVTIADPTALATNVPLAATTGLVTVQVGNNTAGTLEFTVLPVNAVPGSVIGSIPANQGIRAIQVTPDGSRAYVTNPTQNDVVAISIAGGNVITRIPVGLMPQGIGILPDGRRAYVANTGSDNVSVIDIDPASPTYHTVVATIPVGDQPIGVAVAALGPKVFVHNVGSNSISVIDADAANATFDQVLVTASTGSSGNSGNLGVTQDGGLAWAAGATGVVSVNFATNTTALIPTDAAVVDLAITPDQSLVLVLLANGDLLAIGALPSSTDFNQVLVTASTGSSGNSGNLGVTQDGGLAYVTDGAGNIVYVFQITGSVSQQAASIAPGAAVRLVLLTTLTAGDGAAGVDASPDGRFMVVANSGDGTVTVIGTPASLPPIAVGFDFNPNTFNLKSTGMWVKGVIEPPAPWTPEQIVVESLRLEGVVPVAEGSQVEIGDADADGIRDLTVRFDRTALSLLLPEGDAVPVHLTGQIDNRLLEGVDHIRVRRAPVTQPQAGAFTPPGSAIQIAWQVPTGMADKPVTLVWTPDLGRSWQVITSGEANDGAYTWRTPAGTRDSVKVAVIVVESGDPAVGEFEGVLGVSGWFSLAWGPVSVMPAPTTLQFAPVFPNPARGATSLRYGLPRATRVSLDVYDLQGRRVRQLVDGEQPAGWHEASWSGENASGRRVGAGVYFVRLRAGGRTFEQRITMLR